MLKQHDFAEEKILFKLMDNDNDEVRLYYKDFFIVPLGDKLEDIKEKFDKIEAIDIVSPEEIPRNLAKFKFHVLGHMAIAREEVIQRHSEGKLLKAEDLSAAARLEVISEWIKKMENTKLFHSVDTQKGSSGSPLIFYKDKTWYVAGIHVGGLDRSNFKTGVHANYAENIRTFLRTEYKTGKPCFLFCCIILLVK